MIRFKVEFKSVTINMPEFKKETQDLLVKQTKIAALYFAFEALLKIPSYGSLYGRSSLYSTGFVAGTIQNIVDAVAPELRSVDTNAKQILLTQELKTALTAVNSLLAKIRNTPTLIEEHFNTINKPKLIPGKKFPRLAIGKIRISRQRTFIKNESGGYELSHIDRKAITNKILKIKINPYYGKKSAGILKTPTAAIQHGLVTPIKEIFKITPEKVTFTFDTNISYFDIEDITRKHSGPWGAYEAGRQAFYGYIQSQSQSLGSIPTIRYVHQVDFNGSIRHQVDNTQKANDLRL